MLYCCSACFFFFQAEDGIRDGRVTGVQSCALPICPATPDEKAVLVRYVGWGAMPQVFDQRNYEWREARAEAEQLLTPDELAAARASTLNAHYTSPTVVRAMYGALERFGFEYG